MASAPPPAEPACRAPPWRPFAHAGGARRLGLALALATGAVLLWRALPTTAAGLDRIDRVWRDLMVAAEAPAALALARFLEVFAGALVMTPVRVLVALALGIRRAWGPLAVWLGAVAATEGLALLLKTLYDRPRPPEQLSSTCNAAFPSGHTACAASVAFGLVLVLTPPGARRRPLLALALAWTLLVAWSRTYLRDHWLSDVAGGALLGALCVVAAGLAAGRWIRGARRPTAAAREASVPR